MNTSIDPDVPESVLRGKEESSKNYAYQKTSSPVQILQSSNPTFGPLPKAVRQGLKRMGSSPIWIFLISVLLSHWLDSAYASESVQPHPSRAEDPSEKKTEKNSHQANQKDLLSIRERDSLRYHLENTFNELDLLIRNRRVDQFDLQKQEQDLLTLKVYDRIPIDRNLIQLKKELSANAKTFHLEVVQLKSLPQSSTKSKPTPPIPHSIYTNSPYHIQDEQLVETIPLQFTVRGHSIDSWIESLPNHLSRYLKIDGVKKPNKGSDSTWQISAHTYRFRKIQFPKLKPVNPIIYLPNWAKKNPQRFAQSEPKLWEFVTKSQALIPQAQPLYENKRRFLLNDARLSFFLKTVGSPTTYQK